MVILSVCRQRGHSAHIEGHRFMFSKAVEEKKERRQLGQKHESTATEVHSLHVKHTHSLQNKSSCISLSRPQEHRHCIFSGQADNEERYRSKFIPGRVKTTQSLETFPPKCDFAYCVIVDLVTFFRYKFERRDPNSSVQVPTLSSSSDLTTFTNPQFRNPKSLNLKFPNSQKSEDAGLRVSDSQSERREADKGFWVMG